MYFQRYWPVFIENVRDFYLRLNDCLNCLPVEYCKFTVFFFAWLFRFLFCLPQQLPLACYCVPCALWIIYCMIMMMAVKHMIFIYLLWGKCSDYRLFCIFDTFPAQFSVYFHTGDWWDDRPDYNGNRAKSRRRAGKLREDEAYNLHDSQNFTSRSIA